MHLYLVLKLLVFQNTLINYINHKLLYIKVGGGGARDSSNQKRYIEIKIRCTLYLVN